MRARAVVTSVIASIGVLIVGWQAGSAVQSPVAQGNAAQQQPRTTTGTAKATSATPASSTDGTYTGDSVNTRFGSVQVRVTISGGKISQLEPLQLTDRGNTSVQISNYAAPILASEVIDSQSANVSNVSGATYTTDAYVQSVQSALDQAGF